MYGRFDDRRFYNSLSPYSIYLSEPNKPERAVPEARCRLVSCIVSLRGEVHVCAVRRAPCVRRSRVSAGQLTPDAMHSTYFKRKYITRRLTHTKEFGVRK